MREFSEDAITHSNADEAILIDIEKNEEEEEWSVRSVDEAHTIGSCSSERKRRTSLEAAEELTGDDHRDEDEKDFINIKWFPWIEA